MSTMMLSRINEEDSILPSISSFCDDSDDDLPEVVAVRTSTDRTGVLVSEGFDEGAEKVGMLQIEGRIELRNEQSYKKEREFVQLIMQSHKEDHWSAAVAFGAAPNDWRITKLKRSGQFARKGVEPGWRIHALNNIECNFENQNRIKQLLFKAGACTIVFEVGTIEDIRNLQQA